MIDFNETEDRIKAIRVISAEPDPGNHNKVHVVLEIPFEKDKPNDIEQFFHLDGVKHLAIREAAKITHKQAGWDRMSPLQYMVNGEPVLPTRDADAVRVTVTCQSMP